MNKYKIKVSYSIFYEVNANSPVEALNKAVNNYYSLSNFFSECTADIIENDDDKHKFKQL